MEAQDSTREVELGLKNAQFLVAHYPRKQQQRQVISREYGSRPGERERQTNRCPNLKDQKSADLSNWSGKS